ncbi:MAG: phosphotransferase [Litoreibacter sp.]|nr:phosphotransferase [Litoreibacter sp.]
MAQSALVNPVRESKVSAMGDIELNDISAFLSHHAPELPPVTALEKFPTGQSNPTYKLVCGDQAFVLRAKPSGQLLKSAHLVEREYWVMRALGESAVPVPRMIALAEDETSPIGRAFFVMEMVEGRIFWDPATPELSLSERSAVYDEMNRVLTALHEVDVDAAGLTDFGKPGNYFARQTDRWSKQYLASRTDPSAQMDRLMDWLEQNMPEDDGQVALVHGDFRLDNMIFAPDEPKVLALLDWELSTLGHPLADLAYQCMQWRLPHDGGMRGLGGLDRAALGLPDEEGYVARYCARRGIVPPENWSFYLAFAFFRLAAILEGVVRRAKDGNASNPETARTYSAAIPVLAAEANRITQGAPS